MERQGGRGTGRSLVAESHQEYRAQPTRQRAFRAKPDQHARILAWFNSWAFRVTRLKVVHGTDSVPFRNTRNGTESVPYRTRPPKCYPRLNHAGNLTQRLRERHRERQEKTRSVGFGLERRTLSRCSLGWRCLLDTHEHLWCSPPWRSTIRDGSTLVAPAGPRRAKRPLAALVSGRPRSSR